jgi:hypothetical protein
MITNLIGQFGVGVNLRLKMKYLKLFSHIGSFWFIEFSSHMIRCLVKHTKRVLCYVLSHSKVVTLKLR